MQRPNIIYKTALAVFTDRKMLMVRTNKNADVFYTLGGKIEPGESESDSLRREVKEEIGVDIVPGSVQFLHEFQAPAYGRIDTLVNIKLYQGELLGEPTPSSEVVEVRYFDSTIEDKHVTAITVQIFAWLKDQGYID